MDGDKKMLSNLKKLRKSKGVNQSELAKIMSVDQTTISKWENGERSVDSSALDKLASFFGVSVDYILGREEQKNSSAKRKGVKIPVLGKVVAGIPIEAIEEIIDYEEITPELAQTGDFFALSVTGNSMEPRICEGDVVIVKKQPNVDCGDIAIVLVNGDEATIKKVMVHENGISLIAFNTTVYTPTFYTNEQINSLPVVILGKVVELRGKF